MKKLKTILIVLILLIASGTYAQKVIVDDSSLVVTASAINPPTTCGGHDGSILMTSSVTPVTYHWSGGLSGANPTNLNAGTYTVSATSTATVCTSPNQNVTLAGVSAPVITAQPSGSILCAGEPLTISVTATGLGLTYQWRKNAVDIVGATNAMYTVPVTTTSDGGSYQCIVYSGSCQSNSNVANVTVKPSPVVNVADQVISWPNSATFTATGGGTYAWSTGATTASITTNIAGTYTVTVTGSNACSTTDNATLTVNGGPLTISSITANPANICIGESSQLNLVVIDGTLPYSYAWSTGATGVNQLVTPNVTTAYTVTVTDANNATQVGSVTVFVDTPPTANAGLDQTINITDTTQIGTPSVPGCTYAWSNGSVSANPLVWPLVTTTYTVTVTSAGGCTATDQVVVYIIGGPFIFADPIVPITSSLGTTITQGQTTQLMTLVSGGTPPYAYAWTSVPVGFTSTIYNPWVNPITTTAYTVIATDAVGATLTAQITIVVNIPNPPTADVGYNTQNQTICSGDSTSFVINLGGMSPWSVTYNDGANVTISNITSSPYTVWVSPTATTNYLLVSVTDSINQTTNCGGGFTITVNPSPTVILGPDQAVCSGTQVSLFDQSGNLYSNYAWSTGATTSSISPSPTVTTTYILTAFMGMCPNSDTVIVTVNPLPTIDAGTDHIICMGDSITLTATGGVSYNWMPIGMSGTSVTVTPATAFTTYTVTGYSNFGCPGTDQVSVIANPLPLADAGADQTICIGNSATLTATGGGTYLWSNATTNATATVQPNSTTIYTVTVTSNNCSATDTVIVIVSPLPTVNAGSDIAGCVGQALPFNIITGGATIYSWLPATGISDASIANPTVTPTVAGTTTYTVVVTNAAGCWASDQINVTGNAIPVITASDVFGCEDATIQLNASASVAGCSFTWGPTTGLSNAYVANPIATLTNTTTYSVMALSPNGCPATKLVAVTVTPLPVADFAAYVVPDLSGSVEFSNYSTDTTTCHWNFGDGTTSTLVNPIHAYTANGNYNVWLTATNQCGSDSINHVVSGITIGIEEVNGETFNITVYPNPVVDMIHVAGTEKLQYLEVFNINGQKVYEQQIPSNQNSVEFDASSYAKGMYTIRFTTLKGNVFPMQIVK